MNYAIMRNMFGDLWVGKTKLEPNGIGIFATWNEALETALDFWPNEDNCAELKDALEEEAETILTDAQKWIVT